MRGKICSLPYIKNIFGELVGLNSEFMKQTVIRESSFFIQNVETNMDWNMCIDNNGSILGRCVHACNGKETCEMECLKSFKDRQTNCPCEVNRNSMSSYFGHVFRARDPYPGWKISTSF